ncbi:MAG: hypothetical protein ABI599_11230 [Flavobacteriales bacterium]
MSYEELAAYNKEHNYVPSRWEERFDICEMEAILHMLHHLVQGLPGFLGRALLRRASRLPKLHGHFGPYNGKLGFHAEESAEVIGMGEMWRVNEAGERERIW